MGNVICSGFILLFGFYCSGYFSIWGVILRSGCSVDFVDKMWENLRESMWASWWKKLGGFVEKKVLHIIVGKNPQYEVNCGKIFRRFTHRCNRGNYGVLHVLHRAYYYNY